MQRLLYLLVYPLLWGISKLPYRTFYLFSDGVFFMIYYIVEYRKKVVLENLQLAFPEKSMDDIKHIRKKFYHHFCDIFLEMIKTISMSEEELKQRFVLKNPGELKRLEAQGKSYVIMLGHYNSYEWLTSLKLQGMTYKAFGIYKKIKNPYFDKLIRNLRGKFDTEMIDKNDIPRKMIENRNNNVLASYGMIADQSPKLRSSNYWLSFFKHQVPVFIGSEKMAKRLDLAVTYLKIEKSKRGFYEAELIALSDEPQRVEDYKITDHYFELLENQIRKNPANYLWTHKRWKHAKN